MHYNPLPVLLIEGSNPFGPPGPGEEGLLGTGDIDTAGTPSLEIMS